MAYWVSIPDRDLGFFRRQNPGIPSLQNRVSIPDRDLGFFRLYDTIGSILKSKGFNP